MPFLLSNSSVALQLFEEFLAPSPNDWVVTLEAFAHIRDCFWSHAEEDLPCALPRDVRRVWALFVHCPIVPKNPDQFAGSARDVSLRFEKVDLLEEAIVLFPLRIQT